MGLIISDLRYTFRGEYYSTYMDELDTLSGERGWNQWRMMYPCRLRELIMISINICYKKLRTVNKVQWQW